ncbi:cbb3-type cytochrome oxidase assembly protein CcoS [Pseudoteredinibacter isoporae]|uniref:Cbb3-type cytochrome oxidase maturation protein n=1 Tax=Pseudoteredinibacter isoporae TaxID=570281 RepID=A0A7X0JYE9_9GAMM|nr:cbb3-type cytochrome oxidase assembly protein CcoS [Pseudoteredinibacter isoporae]MBB6523551.1 cbb3-type cytochrome oxidase maturation protein [Pseudoteredinibacter isoporae]NHO89059.1 cbb3-type cytochrome oxidase assembly protein CcoS [Pseudoteredinibacter isoporae]NIB22330.1 cbb3-type cytochrome oxidase assembly protein CcoS [Pseudoteredinibacter isoporae]
MDSLYILIPIAIVFVIIAAKVFFWAVDNHQFDDLDTEGQRILFDDDAPVKKSDSAPKASASDATDADSQSSGDDSQ